MSDMIAGDAGDVTDEGKLEREKAQFIRSRIAAGLPVIFFRGGPYDGKVYVGNLPPHGHFLCWDVTDETERGRRIARYIYQYRQVTGQAALGYVRTEDGPAKDDTECKPARQARRAKDPTALHRALYPWRPA